MKKALVLGAGGFIGSHMVKRLKDEGYWIRGVDLKFPEFSKSKADDFVIGDLSNYLFLENLINYGYDEIYQFAADMGGAGYIFTGDNDSKIMENSALINLNLLRSQLKFNKKNKTNSTKIFYSSSACIYPEHMQLDTKNSGLKESDAYPANPDSEYGWEKLFSERMYLAFNRNNDIPVAIARYHNIYGPEGTWNNGKEKAPAAICRKVIEAKESIEIWGDGEQTRSFLYIDDCIEATRKLMKSNLTGPINIGSEEIVSINKLIRIACSVEDKTLLVNHVDGPTGVRGRNSNNDLIKEKLNWTNSINLEQGIKQTYLWIKDQINK